MCSAIGGWWAGLAYQNQHNALSQSWFNVGPRSVTMAHIQRSCQHLVTMDILYRYAGSLGTCPAYSPKVKDIKPNVGLMLGKCCK